MEKDELLKQFNKVISSLCTELVKENLKEDVTVAPSLIKTIEARDEFINYLHPKEKADTSQDMSAEEIAQQIQNRILKHFKQIASEDFGSY